MRLGSFLFPMTRRKHPDDPKSVGIPPRPFLYALDQIAMLISVAEKELRTHYVFYEGRSVGARPRDRLLARNIAPEHHRPEWRVAEQELVRWMKAKGFRFHERDPWLKI